MRLILNTLSRGPLWTLSLFCLTTHADLQLDDARHPETQFRVHAFAREQVIVTNPIRWSQFTYLIPEGTMVQEGDLLFELDLAVPEHRQVTVLNRIAEHENQSRTSLAAIEDRVISLRDQKEQLRDQREVQQARLTYLRSLPRAEDVAIARGRLEVATRNLEAARTELNNARSRLERGLIAPATVQQAETAFQMQEARTAFAQNRLRSAMLPAHSASVRIVELRIANQELEIDKLENDIASQEELLRIESRARDRQAADLQRELAEVEEELRFNRVLAPRAGVVIYTSRLKRELATGGKPPRGMALAEIPDPDSLALRGRIPEDLRPIFRVGDPVEVTLNPMPDRIFTGRLHSISPLPRDIGELDRRGGEEATETGVKVHDVVITLDEIPANIPFGVFGMATLRTAAPLRGPSVPLSWTRVRDGSHHLSLNGTFVKVQGVPVGTRFVITEEGLPLNRISPDGEWAAGGTEEMPLDTDRVTATGQLQPLESVSIEVPPVRGWDMRVSFLISEDSRVEAGDLLVELDSERITQQVNQAENELTRRIGDRETAEEQLNLRRREAAFQVGSARNRLDIRKLELELARSTRPVSQIHQGILDESIAGLQLASARRDLERIRSTPELSSDAEIRRRDREVQRRELLLEQAGIQRRLAEEGSGPVELSLARLEMVRQEASLAQLESTWNRNLIQSESNLRRRQRQERERRSHLERMQAELASLSIRSPGNGIVKYENLWDGVGVSKLRLGMGVWSRTPLMSLSDDSRMVVRVAVSERHVPQLTDGLRVQVRIPSLGSRIWQGEVVRRAEILEPAESGVLRTGIFANQEPPLEHVIGVEVLIEDSSEIELKPGAIAHVVFPFAR